MSNKNFLNVFIVIFMVTVSIYSKKSFSQDYREFDNLKNYQIIKKEKSQILTEYRLVDKQNIKPYKVYEAKYLRNFDGTGVYLLIDVFPGVKVERNLVFPLKTPNILGDCKKESRLAEMGRNYVEEIFMNSSSILIRNVSKSKFSGEIYAEVFVDNKNFYDLYTKKEFASYKEKSWCK